MPREQIKNVPKIFVCQVVIPKNTLNEFLSTKFLVVFIEADIMLSVCHLKFFTCSLSRTILR